MQACRGFTLVEALSVLAVTGTVLALAVPPLGVVVQTTRLATASNDVLASLLLARSEAIKRKLRVVMCKSADGQSCTTAGGWQQGWIVFADANNDAQRTADEQLLHVGRAASAAMRLTGTTPVARYVSYAPDGATKTVGGGFQAGTLTVCVQSAKPGTGRQVIINADGRPRTQKVQLASCA